MNDDKTLSLIGEDGSFLIAGAGEQPGEASLVVGDGIGGLAQVVLERHEVTDLLDYLTERENEVAA